MGIDDLNIVEVIKFWFQKLENYSLSLEWPIILFLILPWLLNSPFFRCIQHYNYIIHHLSLFGLFLSQSLVILLLFSGQIVVAQIILFFSPSSYTLSPLTPVDSFYLIISLVRPGTFHSENSSCLISCLSLYLGDLSLETQSSFSSQTESTFFSVSKLSFTLSQNLDSPFIECFTLVFTFLAHIWFHKSCVMF